jgi:hypothetical protein
MFVGLSPTGPSSLPRPPLPHSAPIDTTATLRAEAAEIAVEFLAVAVAKNTIATSRWLALSWGVDDLRDAGCLARAAALDPSSPPWKLAMAREALHTACWRFKLATGRDGVALARQHIVRSYGAAVADAALKPLVDSAAASAWLDDLMTVGRNRCTSTGANARVAAFLAAYRADGGPRIKTAPQPQRPTGGAVAAVVSRLSERMGGR